ncbi:MAG: hypothetical protein IJ323_03100 [Clostridia bacterium]|nr:hypothetical protein [Clostridia bacterium]
MLEIIKKLFFGFVAKRKILFDLLVDYEDYVGGQNVSVRDTLLGSMKNAEQYDVNLKHNFYHVPVGAVDNPEEVRFVALYRSKNFFVNDNPGVTHYGRVVSFSKVKRRDIKELPLNFSQDNEYYRFDVAEWQTLENPIKARDLAPMACYMTSFYLLNNSKFVYELYIEDNNELKLFLALRDTVNRVHDGFFVGDIRVFIAFSRIIVLTPKGSSIFKIKNFKRFPAKTLTIINGILFNRE